MSRLNVDKITGATGTASGAPITLSGDTATLGSGVDLGLTANHSGVKTALNASGTAPIYACRAWVNFNGDDNSIRGSGNVSSITDHGAGSYSVNFTTAMSDVNYSSVAACAEADVVNRRAVNVQNQSTSVTKLNVTNSNTGSAVDEPHVYLAIFR